MLKLNVNRTFTVPVPVTYVDEVGKDQNGEFRATFRTPSKEDIEATDNQGKRLLDVVLVSVDELELTDLNDQVLSGDELLLACKADHTLGAALMAAYWENVAKKHQPRT